MTRKEMSEIFGILLLAYPNAEAFRGGIAKLGSTIDLWATCLPDICYWEGRLAAAKLVRECKFPPTIAEFREKAEDVRTEVKREVSAAWSRIRMELYLGRSAQEIFDSLPADSVSRKAVEAIGGPKHITITRDRIYADGRQDTIDIYNQKGFANAYIQALSARVGEQIAGKLKNTGAAGVPALTNGGTRRSGK